MVIKELVRAAGCSSMEPQGTQKRLNALRANLKRRHMVVDDTATNRRLMKAYLAGSKLEVDMAGSATEALKMMEALGINEYDIVWTDLKMDEMDGMELAKQLRAKGFEGCIALVSGAHVPVADLEAAGIDEFCLKPMRKKDILGLPMMQIYADFK